MSDLATERGGPPCRDCQPPERSPGCHGRCERYAAYRERWESVRQKRETERTYDLWHREAVMKSIESGHGKHK